jgi:V/A-type H+-transporting ATPase subunit I
MAVERVKKLSIVIHRSAEERVLDLIQSLGCCELIESSGGEGVEAQGTLRRLQDVDDALADVRFVLRFLEPHFSDPDSALARALGKRPSVHLEELETLLGERGVRNLAGVFRDRERRLSEIRSEVGRCTGLLKLLEKLQGFPYNLSILTRGTERVRGMLGSLPKDSIDAFQSDIAEETGSLGEVLVFDGGEKKDKDALVALFFPTDSAKRVEEALSVFAFSRIELPAELSDSVENEQQRLTALLEELGAEERALLRMIDTDAAELVPDMRKLLDYLTVLRSRLDTLVRGERTEQVVISKVWCPESRVPDVKKVLSPFETEMELLAEDPDSSDSPPTVLSNPSWVHPFEPLTKLYGVPSYGGVDPTAFMAPFFFVFFGMCLGDGGYGLIMAGLLLYALRKFPITGETKKFFVLLFLGGISTVFVGMLTGTWMGNMIDAFPFLSVLKPLKDKVMVLDPMNDPITFLGISLALGVVQILFGLCIALVENLRKGEYLAGVGDQGGWLLLLVGLLLLGVGTQGLLSPVLVSLAKGMSLLGALLLVVTQGREKPGVLGKAISGMLSLYNVTSYLGDILSYSRLLALGLASAAIAMIVNMLATLVWDIPYVGWALALLIFFGGHVFSLAVNILGAFIHSLRLQYVEFFSKFFSAGGRAINPLRYETRYVFICKDYPE